MESRVPFDVIVLSGKAGAGKSTIASLIAQIARHGGGNLSALPANFLSLLEKLELKKYDNPVVEVVALADSLKEYLFAIECCTEKELVASQKTKELRKLFTSTADTLRKDHGKFFFCNTTFAKLLLSAHNNTSELFIVPDMREEHELEFFRAKRSTGYIDRLVFIHIHAPNRVAEALSKQVGSDEEARLAQSSHSSETGLDHMTRDKETAEANGFIWFDNDMSFK